MMGGGGLGEVGFGDFSEGEEGSSEAGAVSRRGAEMVLEHLMRIFRDQAVGQKLGKLWTTVAEGLGSSPEAGGGGAIGAEGGQVRGVEEMEKAQQCMNSLQVLRCVVRVVSPEALPKVLTFLGGAVGAVRHWHAAVRLTAGRCLATLAGAAEEPVMSAILSQVLPLLGDTAREAHRRGAATAVRQLVGTKGEALAAYSALLVVPLLARMSDPSPAVRHLTTRSFAALVPLLPLSRGLPPPPCLNSSQVAKAEEDSHFLEQLLDNSKVDDYRLHVPLNVTLRRYICMCTVTL